MTRSLCRIVAYVRHTNIEAWLRSGWMALDDLGGRDAPHGEFSILMGWPHSCEPVMPKVWTGVGTGNQQ